MDKLEIGFKYCHENARQLIEDAKLLFKHKKYPRAVALAIIALEEYGKAELLIQLASGPITKEDLDIFIKETFYSHYEKQKAGCKEEFLRTMKGKTDIWYQISNNPKFFESKKWSSLYVSIDRGLNFKTPSVMTEKIAKDYIAFVARKIYELTIDEALGSLTEMREIYLAYQEEIRLSNKNGHLS